MNYPFSKKSSLSRIVSLTLVMLLMLAMLSGCSMISSLIPQTEPTTESTEPPTEEQPSIIEEPETTEPPTTETTVPPTTAKVKKEDVAVVKEQMAIRSSPSTGSRVITQLDAGDEVEVHRIEPIGTVQWAYVSSEELNVMGWVVTEMLDMSNVQIAAGSTATPANPESNTTAPTQGSSTPVNSITGTGTSSTPANSQSGTVTTNTLNIRATASTNGDRVGTYTFGDRITILETKDGWGRTDKGWVSLNYVNMNNGGNNTTAPTTPATPSGNGNATVTGSGVNVRSGAGTDYPIVGTVNRGDSLNILETTSVGTKQWGRTSKGWVCMDYVSVTGTIGGGNTAPSGNGNATVTGSTVNVRSGAGTDQAVVGTVKQGQSITILETMTIGASQWGRTAQGWVCMDYVRMN